MAKKKKKYQRENQIKLPKERIDINGVSVSTRNDDVGPEHIWSDDAMEAKENLILEQVQTAVNGRKVGRGRRLDHIERLHASGLIDDGLLDAGKKFKSDFDHGALSGYPEPKFEFSSPTTGDSAGFISVERARTRINAAIIHLGGHNSQEAKVAWDLIGLEKSINQSTSGGKKSERMAWNNVLISTLKSLYRFYF